MRFVKVLNHLREEYTDEELKTWSTLAYIYERKTRRVETRTTDLVQKLEFGTGPTVHKRVLELANIGAIEVRQNNQDARSKVLIVTRLGERMLADFDEKLQEVL